MTRYPHQPGCPALIHHAGTTGECNCHVAEIDTLTAELAEANKSRAFYDKLMEALSSNQTIGDVMHLKEQLAAVLQREVEHEMEIVRLTQQLAASESRVKALEGELDVQRGRVDDYSTELVKAQEQIARLEKELAEARLLAQNHLDHLVERSKQLAERNEQLAASEAERRRRIDGPLKCDIDIFDQSGEFEVCLNDEKISFLFTEKLDIINDGTREMSAKAYATDSYKAGLEIASTYNEAVSLREQVKGLREALRVLHVKYHGAACLIGNSKYVCCELVEKALTASEGE